MFFFWVKWNFVKTDHCKRWGMDTPAGTAPAVAYSDKTNLLSQQKPIFPYNIFYHILKAWYFLSYSFYHILKSFKILIIFQFIIFFQSVKFLSYFFIIYKYDKNRFLSYFLVFIIFSKYGKQKNLGEEGARGLGKKKSIYFIRNHHRNPKI